MVGRDESYPHAGANLFGDLQRLRAQTGHVAQHQTSLKGPAPTYYRDVQRDGLSRTVDSICASMRGGAMNRPDKVPGRPRAETFRLWLATGAEVASALGVWTSAFLLVS